jgi:hypothetical protein
MMAGPLCISLRASAKERAHDQSSIWFALLLMLLASTSFAQLDADNDQFVHQSYVGGVIEAGDAFGGALATGDFDGDGFMDLAIGAPDEDIGLATDAGTVFVTYGSAAGLGLGARAPLVLDQNFTGASASAEAGDNFGAALVSGDFNGDTYDDLAVGVPNEGFEIDPGVFVLFAGAVHVFYGSSSGLGTSDQFLTGDSFVSSWGIGWGDELGAALAAGNVTGDSRDDLLIGVPGGPNAPEFKGVVILVAGSLSGLDPPSHGVFVPPGREAGDRFGSALAIGDLDDWGRPDPIMGAPYADLDAAPTDSGAVWMLLSSGYQTFTGGADNDHFATAIAVGDFKGGGYPQLLVSLPGRYTDNVEESGLSFIYDIAGSNYGGVWQGFAGHPGVPEPFDHFAEALATGDFNGDGYDDAAFGVPGEDLFDGAADPVVDAGIVQIAYGSSLGLSSTGAQVWSLEDPVFFGSWDDDRYGGALATGDFNGDGADDLGVGVPGALWNTQAGTGFVHIIYGQVEGIFADGFESGDVSAWSASVP